MLDYLIVGSGLAGISFAEIALKNNKSILLIDDKSQIPLKSLGAYIILLF